MFAPDDVRIPIHTCESIILMATLTRSDFEQSQLINLNFFRTSRTISMPTTIASATDSDDVDHERGEALLSCSTIKLHELRARFAR